MYAITSVRLGSQLERTIYKDTRKLSTSDGLYQNPVNQEEMEFLKKWELHRFFPYL